MDNDQSREALLNMKDTEGWSLVESYIHSRIQDNEKSLLSCKLEEVEAHRERRRALVLLLEHIEEGISG